MDGIGINTGTVVESPDRALSKSAYSLVYGKPVHPVAASVVISQAHTPMMEQSYARLEQRKAGYFIPETLLAKNQILVMPGQETLRSIQGWGNNHLWVTRSTLHNQGVHLRGDTGDVLQCQVVDCYSGHSLRKRAAGAKELRRTGVRGERIAQPQWLVWHQVGRDKHFCERLPCFQSTSSAWYFDEYGRKVYLGVDAIDSPAAIGHINCDPTKANILIMLAIDPRWVVDSSGDDIQVRSDIPENGYCLLAVAKRDIIPGEELLMRYDDNVAFDEGHYFWGADEYLYSLIAHHSGSDVPCTLKTTDGLLKLGYSLTETAEKLHGLCFNPLTQNDCWTPGALQYFCELADISAPDESYRHLTYLQYCLSPNGVLDNQGRNYLAGFLNKHIKSVFQGSPCLNTLDEVCCYLQSLQRLIESRFFQAPVDQELGDDVYIEDIKQLNMQLAWLQGRLPQPHKPCEALSDLNEEDSESLSDWSCPGGDEMLGEQVITPPPRVVEKRPSVQPPVIKQRKLSDSDTLSLMVKLPWPPYVWREPWSDKENWLERRERFFGVSKDDGDLKSALEDILEHAAGYGAEDQWETIHCYRFQTIIDLLNKRVEIPDWPELKGKTKWTNELARYCCFRLGVRSVQFLTASDLGFIRPDSEAFFITCAEWLACKIAPEKERSYSELSKRLQKCGVPVVQYQFFSRDCLKWETGHVLSLLKCAAPRIFEELVGGNSNLYFNMLKVLEPDTSFYTDVLATYIRVVLHKDFGEGEDLSFTSADSKAICALAGFLRTSSIPVPKGLQCERWERSSINAFLRSQGLAVFDQDEQTLANLCEVLVRAGRDKDYCTYRDTLEVLMGKGFNNVKKSLNRYGQKGGGLLPIAGINLGKAKVTPQDFLLSYLYCHGFKNLNYADFRKALKGLLLAFTVVPKVFKKDLRTEALFNELLAIRFYQRPKQFNQELTRELQEAPRLAGITVEEVRKLRESLDAVQWADGKTSPRHELLKPW